MRSASRRAFLSITLSLDGGDGACSATAAVLVRQELARRLSLPSGNLSSLDQKPFELRDHETVILDLRKPGHCDSADAASGTEHDRECAAVRGEPADVKARVGVEVPAIGAELATHVVRRVPVPLDDRGLAQQPSIVVG